jgi:hypothetical protein
LASLIGRLALEQERLNKNIMLLISVTILSTVAMAALLAATFVGAIVWH